MENLQSFFSLEHKTFKEEFKYVHATVAELTIELERTVGMRL